MACHYPELGHTLPVVGAVYVRWTRRVRPFDQFRLVSFNTATGWGTFAGGRLIRLSELSRWHRVLED